MDTEETAGRDLQGADEEGRRIAASTMGRARTEKKLNALAENRLKFTGHTAETRALLSEKQKERREREKQERAALGLDASPVDKQPRGRPRKEKPVDPATKRPRGRPPQTDKQIP